MAFARGTALEFLRRAHAPKGLIPYVNKGELAVVYCFVFFYIFLRGSGSWSIDALMGKGKASPRTPA